MNRYSGSSERRADPLPTLIRELYPRPPLSGRCDSAERESPNSALIFKNIWRELFPTYDAIALRIRCLAGGQNCKSRDEPYNVARNEPRSSVWMRTGPQMLRPIWLEQHALQRFAEEILAPHDRFVNTQSFVDVIDAAAEDSFPLGVGHDHMLLTQRRQDLHRGRPIEVRF